MTALCVLLKVRRWCGEMEEGQICGRVRQVDSDRGDAQIDRPFSQLTGQSRAAIEKGHRCGFKHV